MNGSPDSIFTAEDAPEYLHVQGSEPVIIMTDEDFAMSATQVLYRGSYEDRARAALAEHLRAISRFEFVRREKEDPMYLSAAWTIIHGAASVQIHGRVYRIREVTS